MPHLTQSTGRVVFTSFRACRHDELPRIRWEYLSPDESYGSGSMVCPSCRTHLGRIRINGGALNGDGPFFEALRKVVDRDRLTPRDLEIIWVALRR
jgi:hypothetical protein